MMRFVDLWRWDGTVGRRAYLLVGVIGFAIKHNLDRLVASAMFHQRWGIFNYWIPPEQLTRLHELSPDQRNLLVTLLVMAVPFIWVGVTMTLKRLRSAGLPTWLVALFFAPFINLIFFLLLALLPSRCDDVAAAPTATSRRDSALGRLIPDHPLGSAVAALIATVLLGLGATAFNVTTLQKYGWGLFVLLPFCLGFVSVLIYGYHKRRSYLSCLFVSGLSVTFLGIALVTLAFEGVLCLLMAAPIAYVLACMGTTIGYVIQWRPWDESATTSLMLALVLAVPLLMGAEYVSAPVAPIFAVRTSVEIDAPPATVWRNVVAFAELPPPTEWAFRAGVAYPIRARIHGQGVGAERHCVFSTGAFIEPIQVWEAPHLLRFGVTSNPPPMQEWTPYRAIHPPHLDGFLVSRQGQFLLTPLPGGRTRLEGTTWYQHHMWPVSYWRLWSDRIIHMIHRRVLRHIKGLAERQA